MLACARIGAIHSVVFGGFAAKELATRIDDAEPKVDPLRLLRHRGARGSSPTSRCSTRRSRLAAHKPEACLIFQRPQAEAAMTAGPRPRLGRGGRRGEGGGQPRRLRAGRRHRPALHPLHLRHDRAAEGRRARHRRLSRRAEMVDEGPLRRRAGRGLSGAPPTSAGSSATPTSSTARCCTAAPRVLYEGKPVGTPDAGAFWRVDRRARASSRCSPRRPPSAPSRRRTRTAALIAGYDLSKLPHPVPRRRARRSRHGAMGGAAASACR